MAERGQNGNLEPPFEVANRAAVKHASHADLVLAPRAAELCDYLRELIPAGSEADEPAVTLLAWQLARIERANAYIDEAGLLDGKGVPRPVLKVLSTWENSAARLCDQLGLSPTSRARLGLDLSRTGDALRRHLEHNYAADDDG